MQKWQVTFCFLASAGMIGSRSIWRLKAMGLPPSEHVRQTAVDQLVHAFGEDVTVGGNPQCELRQVLRGLPHDLQPALLTVEARVVPRTVQSLVRGLVVEREALVRAERRERDDIAVRPGAAWHARPELDQHAG